jgi:hypothetical protein
MSDMMVYHVAEFPQQPTKKVNEYPLVGRFVRSKTPRNTKYTTRFYDIYREVDELIGTINHYKRLGKLDEARELMKQNRRKLRARKALTSTRQSLTEINNKIKRIWADKRLSAEAKREQIDNLTQRRNNLVEKVYKIYSRD